MALLIRAAGCSAYLYATSPTCHPEVPVAGHPQTVVWQTLFIITNYIFLVRDLEALCSSGSLGSAYSASSRRTWVESQDSIRCHAVLQSLASYAYPSLALLALNFSHLEPVALWAASNPPDCIAAAAPGIGLTLWLPAAGHCPELPHGVRGRKGHHQL